MNETEEAVIEARITEIMILKNRLKIKQARGEKLTKEDRELLDALRADAYAIRNKLLEEES